MKDSSKLKLQDIYNEILEEEFIEFNGFNDEMLISQVVKFFQKRGVSFTKTMIQNYVRIGLLPPPMEKRYYTKQHLILLMFINVLKSTYALEDIKSILAPILKNPETFDDDLFQVEDLYKAHIDLHRSTLKMWKKCLPQITDEIDEKVEEIVQVKDEKEQGEAFLLLLVLMSHTVAIKKLSQLIGEEFLKKPKKD